MYTPLWTQTDCTVTQTPLCKTKLWEGHPWEVSRPSILYGCGKTGNLITATFAYTCVQCAVSSYELVIEEMVLYTVTVRMKKYSNSQYLLQWNTTDSPHTQQSVTQHNPLHCCTFNLAPCSACNHMVSALLTDQRYFGLPSEIDLHFTISPDTAAWLFGVKW